MPFRHIFSYARVVLSALIHLISEYKTGNKNLSGYFKYRTLKTPLTNIMGISEIIANDPKAIIENKNFSKNL